MWWMKVNTMPGRGYPRDWETMGGGYDGAGNLNLGKQPKTEDYGKVMEFNYEEVFFGGGNGKKAHLAPRESPGWGPNWDEDIATGEYPNAYFFYMPRLCNHCSSPACAQACANACVHHPLRMLRPTRVIWRAHIGTSGAIGAFVDRGERRGIVATMAWPR